jgi:hypothetical protein
MFSAQTVSGHSSEPRPKGDGRRPQGRDDAFILHGEHKLQVLDGGFYPKAGTVHV